MPNVRVRMPMSDRLGVFTGTLFGAPCLVCFTGKYRKNYIFFGLIILRHNHSRGGRPVAVEAGPANGSTRRWLACLCPEWLRVQSGYNFFRVGTNWVWVKIKPPGHGLQGLVLVSIYQGSPFWGAYF